MYIRLIIVALLAFISMGSLAKGFDENYEVLQGDFDGDGDIDLYVRQKPQVILLHGDIITPIVLQPGVDEFVLVQMSDKTFIVEPDTSSIVLPEWQTAALDLILSDFNADKVFDVLIRGVGNVVSGALDLVVMASYQSDEVSAVTPVDESFHKFYSQVHNWLINPDYFEINAPWVVDGVEPSSKTWVGGVGDPTNYYVISSFVDRCVLETGKDCAASTIDPDDCLVYVDLYNDNGEYIGKGWRNVCGIGYTHIYAYEPGSVSLKRDYSVFNQNALAFRDAGFKKVPTSQGQLVLQAILVLLEVLYGDQVEDILDEVKPDILETIGDDVGILNDDKAIILISILNGVCAHTGSGEECIVKVEEELDGYLEREDIDDDKFDIEVLEQWIEMLKKAEEVRRKDPELRHCTYSKQKPQANKVYYGRTSGSSDLTCSEIVFDRDQNHHKNKEGYGPAQADGNGAEGPLGYTAIRGREQQLIDSLVYDLDRPWAADTHGLDSPRSGNGRREIRREHPLGCGFWSASTIAFGETGPYTGVYYSACDGLGVPVFPDEYN